MRIVWAVALSILGACAAKQAQPTAPAPAEPSAVAAADPTPVAVPSPTAAWYCYADTGGAGSDCLRSSDECASEADEWDQRGGTSSPCAPQASAFCYAYVPEDAADDSPITLCSATMADCTGEAAITKPKTGTLTACAEAR